MFTDDGDKVVVTLGMDLNIGKQLEFVGLQGADDLGFEVRSGAPLSDDVGAEDFHLGMGEVGVCENGFNLYETFAQLLVRVPDVVANGEAAAEVQEREHGGGEVLALGRFAPVGAAGEAKDEGFNGGVALRLERGNQGVDALTRSRNHVLVRDDAEAIWGQDQIKRRDGGHIGMTGYELFQGEAETLVRTEAVGCSNLVKDSFRNEGIYCPLLGSLEIWVKLFYQGGLALYGGEDVGNEQAELVVGCD